MGVQLLTISRYMGRIIQDKSKEVDTGEIVKFLVSKYAKHGDPLSTDYSHKEMIDYVKRGLFDIVYLNVHSDIVEHMHKNRISTAVITLNEAYHSVVKEIGSTHESVRDALINNISYHVAELLLEIAFGMRFLIQERMRKGEGVNPEFGLSTDIYDGLVALNDILKCIETSNISDIDREVKRGIRSNLCLLVTTYITSIDMVMTVRKISKMSPEREYPIWAKEYVECDMYKMLIRLIPVNYIFDTKHTYGAIDTVRKFILGTTAMDYDIIRATMDKDVYNKKNMWTADRERLVKDVFGVCIDK